MSPVEPCSGFSGDQQLSSMSCRWPPHEPKALGTLSRCSTALPQSRRQNLGCSGGRAFTGRSSFSSVARPGGAGGPGPSGLGAGTPAQAGACQQAAAPGAGKQEHQAQAGAQASRATPSHNSSIEQERAGSPPGPAGSSSNGSSRRAGTIGLSTTTCQQHTGECAAPAAVRTVPPCCTSHAQQDCAISSVPEGPGGSSSMGALSPSTAVRRKAAFFDALVQGMPPPAMGPIEAMAPALAGRLALDAAGDTALAAPSSALPEVELVANPQHNRQEGCTPLEPVRPSAQEAQRSLPVSVAALSPTSPPDPLPATPQQQQAWSQQPAMPGRQRQQAMAGADQQQRQAGGAVQAQQLAEHRHRQEALMSQQPPASQAAQQAHVEAGARAGGPSNCSGSAIELQEQGHEEAMLNTIARLEREQQDKDVELAGLRGALQRKSQECANLMGVVRELTTSRAKLVCAKTTLAEQLAELRHEQMRLARVADLSRTVSKENVAKAARAQRSLRTVEDECAQQKQVTNYLQQRNAVLKGDNQDLRRRIMLLERLDVMRYAADSVCMREFQLYALKESY